MSGGALLLFGGGLALYQATTLVLAPAGSARQLELSISAPSTDTSDFSQPVITSGNLVVGTMAQSAAPAASRSPVPRPVRAAVVPKSIPTATASPMTPLPTVAATPAPKPSVHPTPVIITPLPTPVVPRGDD